MVVSPLSEISSAIATASGGIRQPAREPQGPPGCVLVAADGQVLCELATASTAPMTGRNRRYLEVVQRKLGACITARPRRAFRGLANLLKWPGGGRETIDLLALVLQQRRAGRARGRPNGAEVRVPTKTHVLNLLHRAHAIHLGNE